MPLTTHQSLPKGITELLVERIGDGYGDIVSIFLFGSGADGTWTRSSDLDVGVIVDPAEDIDSPSPFILKGVPVELHVHPRDRFERVEEVAGASGFGAHVINSIIVYDLTNFFRSVKSGVVKIYFTAPFIQKRMHNSPNVARNYVRNAEKFLSEGKIEFVPPSIHRAVNSGIAMALFHAKKSNPTQRRCLDRLASILTEPKEHNLYLWMVNLLNLNTATLDLASKAIVEAKKLHTMVSLYLKRKGGCLWRKNKHWYNMMTQRYVIDGARKLLKEMKYPASIFCTMTLTNSPEIYDQIMPYSLRKTKKKPCIYLDRFFSSKEPKRLGLLQ